MKSQLARIIGWVKKHRLGFAVGIVILLAIFFRFWQLSSLPPGLHPDEAANGQDVFRILSGDIRPLYNTNGPREALFFFLQTIFVVVFGNTILALRIAPALIGVLTVALTYLWTKAWFSHRTALLAALFTATGSWAVTLNRDGFRANMIPLMIALLAWLVTLAITKRRWYWWALCGAVYGLGFYTYISWQITPLLIITILIAVLFKYGKKAKSLLVPLLIFGLFGLIVLSPLAAYALKHPGDVIGGRSSVSFTNPEINGGEPLKTLTESVAKTAVMFNWQGDPNYRHNLGGAPMLNAVVGILFLFGFFVSLTRLKNLRYFSLLAIFGWFLVPEMVTAEGIPHGLRAIGAIPVVYILAAIGLTELIARWRTVFPVNPFARLALWIMVSLILVAALAYDYQRYFVAWANAPETYEAYSEDVVGVANYLKDHSFDGKRYAVVGEYDDKVVQYLTHDKGVSYQRLEPSQIGQVDFGGPTEVVVIESWLSQVQPYLQSQNISFKVETVNSDYRIHTPLFTVYEKTP